MTDRVVILARLLVSLALASATLPSARADDGMVLVPAGEFAMGNPAGGEGFDDERPQRRVYVGAFLIDRHEVTNADYERFVHETGHRAPENNNPAATVWDGASAPKEIAAHPVVNVGWADAAEYCRWAGKRLPSEAEWEKAARGTDGRRYPWGNEWSPSLANSASYWAGRTIEFKTGDEWNAFWMTGEGARISKERGIKGEVLTLPVGSFPDGVSPYGLFDMAGNASEWVEDWYDPGYYAKAPASDPPGPAKGSVKVMRGGSWLKPASSLRTGDRDYGTLQARPSGAGFRCAKDDR